MPARLKRQAPPDLQCGERAHSRVSPGYHACALAQPTLMQNEHGPVHHCGCGFEWDPITGDRFYRIPVYHLGTERVSVLHADGTWDVITGPTAQIQNVT